MNLKIRKFLIVAIASGLVTGIAVAALNPGTSPILGFITSAVITALCVFLLQLAVQKLSASRQITIAVFIAFFLRLIIGVLLFILLPSHGYDEPYNNNGYLYLDAYQRDLDAWQLSQSDAPIYAAFQEEFSTDQYGGLLTFSAAIYRYLSPDGHRPILILILTSFFYAAGIPFFWNAVEKFWGEKTANASVWIYALYPETIILGASQMREPILIGLSAVAFWGVSVWEHSKKKSSIAMVSSLVAMVFISSKATIAILAAIALWFWMEHIHDRSSKQVRMLSWIFLFMIFSVGLYLGWSWLVDSSKWDLYLVESASGRIQWELELVGRQFRVPFIIAYGLAQPVLPATIVYPGIPITRAVAVFRAIGWYLLIPLMVTGFISLFNQQDKKNKRIMLLFFAMIIVWTVISSARAGGDQWDNPRYRSIYLIWMALTAGWAWVQTITKHTFWLWRLLLVELIYTSAFVQWYLNRYYDLFTRLPFWPMIKLLLAIGAVIIAGGFLFDFGYAKYKERENFKF